MSRDSREEVADLPRVGAERQKALRAALTPFAYKYRGGEAFVKAYISHPDFAVNSVFNPATGDTLLHELVKFYGTEDLVEDLLTIGARYDIPNSKGQTALDLALTSFAYYRCGKAIVKKAYMDRSDFDVNAVINASTGETLLHLIVKFNRTDDLVKHLLSIGARYDIPNSKGQTALDLALIGGINHLITDGGEALVKAYISPSDFDANAVINTETGETLLHRLIKVGATKDLLQELLARGARYDIPDSTSKTAFDLALIGKYITDGGQALVKAYMSHSDFDANAVINTETGETLLHRLIKLSTTASATKDLLQELLTRGARYDIPDSSGKTAFDLALAPDRYDFLTPGGEALVKAYMSLSDVDVNAVINTKTGETLIHALVKLRLTEELVHNLLTRGARCDIPDSKGKTALDIVFSQQSEGKISEPGKGLLAFKRQQDALASASASAAAVPASELLEGKEDGDDSDGEDLPDSAAAAAGSREIAGDSTDYGADL